MKILFMNNFFVDEYKKYKRLSDIGVPFLQFKPKMIAEGLDPAVLEVLFFLLAFIIKYFFRNILSFLSNKNFFFN